MQFLLCLSPTVLDYSLPKDKSKLAKIKIALGIIQNKLENGKINLIFTQVLKDIVDPQEPEFFHHDNYSEDLSGILFLLKMWFFQQHEGILAIKTSDVSDENFYKHPVPKGIEVEGQVDLWQKEVGRMLYIHNEVNDDDKYFIGVACEFAFAGKDLNEYDNPNESNCFPLVGPNNLDTLVKSWKYDVSAGIHDKKIKYSDILKNYQYIDATEIVNGGRGSHFKVKFKNGKSWTLDINCDEIPRDHLRTLKKTTGYPVPVLKDCLINGHRPKKVSKLEGYLL